MKTKKTSLDTEQHELLEKAQSRIRQKKRLYYHFILFLVGSIFMILFNKIFKYGENYNWFVWGITAWAFILFIHFINVFVTDKFLGKGWERKQRERLIALQKSKIEKIQTQVEKEYPLPSQNKNSDPV